jgi:hypothetical protein
MKVSEYIKLLEELKDKNGDLEVYEFHLSGTYRVAMKPTIMALRLRQGREIKIKRWESYHPPELKGENVIEV